MVRINFPVLHFGDLREYQKDGSAEKTPTLKKKTLHSPAGGAEK